FFAKSEGPRACPYSKVRRLMAKQKLLFIGGLHRSGTSPLFRALRDHPDISRFRNTGVPEDEGPLLQTVYPPAWNFGGAGWFGFHSQSHLTEDSPLATPQNAARLMEEWGQRWDLTRSVLMEKSPPNLLMTRFLQELFPEAYFLIVVRHPIPTSL